MSEQKSSSLGSFSDAIVRAVETASQQVVSVAARHRLSASGLYWRDGLVVTADHVVERDDAITLDFGDGAEAKASLAGRDPTTDLALLRVEGGNRSQPRPLSTDEVKVGQPMVAVARPREAGLCAGFGVVSALGGPWRTAAGGRIDSYLRPDITLYPGFSGSALADLQGRLVGMNTSGLSRGASVAIPAVTVNRVAEQLLRHGRIAHGFLGLRMQSAVIPQSMRESLGSDQSRGLLVVAVEQGGPAEAAGVLVGDILVTIAGKSVTESDGVAGVLDSETVGRTVDLGIIRGGESRQVPATIAERPRRETSRE